MACIQCGMWRRRFILELTVLSRFGRSVYGYLVKEEPAWVTHTVVPVRTLFRPGYVDLYIPGFDRGFRLMAYACEFYFYVVILRHVVASEQGERFPVGTCGVGNVFR